MTDQQTTPAPWFTSPQDAKAQANAEKAYRKATRPWFRKKRFLILPLALIGLIVTIQAANGGGVAGLFNTAESCSQPTVTSALKAKAVAVGVGRAVGVGVGTNVRDGNFEFVVTGVERPGKTYPGKLQTTLTARGEFVIVRVNVTNIGKQEQGLDSQSQFLFNDKGQTIEPSSAILYTKDALKFVQLIEPNNTVKGAPVVFDVAPGTKIVNIELHDSPCSQGVKVKLS